MALEAEGDGSNGNEGAEDGTGLSRAINGLFAGRLVNYIEVR